MNATALIAEDEPLLAASLQAELRGQWPELAVAGIAPNGPAAVAMALEHRPDVLFLDVRMPGRTGIEAAQELAEEWPEGTPLPLIVFVTAYDEYALRAFDLAAVDYVLKPVRADRLALTCTRLKEGLAKRRGGASDTLDQLRQLLGGAVPAASTRLTVIQASAGNAIHMVRVDDVIYFEAADKYVRLVTAEREHLIRTSLRELLPQLDTQRFWQVHRGTVVRADAIATATRDESGKLTLSLRGHTDKLPVSRLYSHLFKGM
ncbi:LytR/AlgR family response regulator transcription factor [Piscinibacter gummiphilus]|uniref:DNA-binding response regulator n=1 Tax=Piscinibacter gummiphilus TaxID=946333 RepID=A0A1W6LB49_9BURK|nr:LytTR family DNA-binding domain-containing protein [Piscinibacter gummiphilus]ARN21427.1 DNA-binding response regulator [Piscinibacter gummiphilus]ATU66106.1 DNA-binding response regulator [Piscinibacter gummiphilus]GLS96223.1 putative response regulatory protein [Piscinibacter gummiphilus]